MKDFFGITIQTMPRGSLALEEMTPLESSLGRPPDGEYALSNAVLRVLPAVPGSVLALFVGTTAHGIRPSVETIETGRRHPRRLADIAGPRLRADLIFFFFFTGALAAPHGRDLGASVASVRVVATGCPGTEQPERRAGAQGFANVMCPRRWPPCDGPIARTATKSRFFFWPDRWPDGSRLTLLMVLLVAAPWRTTSLMCPRPFDGVA